MCKHISEHYSHLIWSRQKDFKHRARINTPNREEGRPEISQKIIKYFLSI